MSAHKDKAQPQGCAMPQLRGLPKTPSHKRAKRRTIIIFKVHRDQAQRSARRGPECVLAQYQAKHQANFLPNKTTRHENALSIARTKSPHRQNSQGSIKNAYGMIMPGILTAQYCQKACSTYFEDSKVASLFREELSERNRYYPQELKAYPEVNALLEKAYGSLKKPGKSNSKVNRNAVQSPK